MLHGTADGTGRSRHQRGGQNARLGIQKRPVQPLVGLLGIGGSLRRRQVLPLRLLRPGAGFPIPLLLLLQCGQLPLPLGQPLPGLAVLSQRQGHILQLLQLRRGELLLLSGFFQVSLILFGCSPQGRKLDVVRALASEHGSQLRISGAHRLQRGGLIG